MIEQLIHIDQSIFHFINEVISNAVFDLILPVIRNKYTWIPLYIALIVFLYFKYKVKGLWIISFLLLSVGIADPVSAKLIKPGFERPRPCHKNSPITPRQLEAWPCGRGYSFVSSHASNHYAIATTLGLILFSLSPWILYGGWLWAGLICLGQVYIGVHYPFDVLAGALLGICIGIILNKVFLQFITLKDA